LYGGTWTVDEASGSIEHYLLAGGRYAVAFQVQNINGDRAEALISLDGAPANATGERQADGSWVFNGKGSAAQGQQLVLTIAAIDGTGLRGDLLVTGSMGTARGDLPLARITPLP
jgi:hypothetical protein